MSKDDTITGGGLRGLAERESLRGEISEGSRPDPKENDRMFNGEIRKRKKRIAREDRDRPSGQKRIAASSPEPDPKPGDQDVPAILIADLEDRGFDQAADLVRERVCFGVEKYGTRLQTNNGRDPIEDALQEIGDGMQYIKQAIEDDQDHDWARLLEPITAFLDLWSRAQENG